MSLVGVGTEGRGKGKGKGKGKCEESEAPPRPPREEILQVMSRIMAEVEISGVETYTGTAREKVALMKEIHESEGTPGEKAARFGEKYKSFMVACPMMFNKACQPAPLDLGALETLSSMAESRTGDDESAQEFISRMTASRARARAGAGAGAGRQKK